MQTIKLIADKATGEIQVKAQGFHGPVCAEATQFLRDSLGECTDFQQTSAWFEENLELTGDLNTNYCG